MNDTVSKVAGLVLSLFAVFFFGYQIYQFTYTPYDTEIAYDFLYTDQAEIDGTVIKSEQVIDQSGAGVVKYQYDNSQKVSAGSVVASVYATKEALHNDELIDYKQKQKQLLEELESQRSVITTGAQNVVSNIKREQSEIISQLTSNDFRYLEDSRYNFLSQLLRQQMLLDPEANFTDNINKLQTEIDSLSGEVGTQTEITAPVAGYFTGEIDGYEQFVTADALNHLSLEEVRKLVSETKPVLEGEKIGKIITSTEWYFLGIIHTSDLTRLEQGDQVSLVFPSSPSYKIAATVEKIGLYTEEEESVILLKSNIMNDHIIDLRMEKPSIILGSGRGLKVPKQAMRIQQMEEKQEDGTVKKVSQPGVYVTNGQVIKFKKIDIAFESEEYVVSNIVNDDKSYLQLYDEIILGGKDLYDNKPIK